MNIFIGASEREFLEITVLRRSFPAATDYWDGNWLDVEVELLVGSTMGSFSGRLTGSLRTNEIVSFRAELAELYRTLTGSASFSTMDEWLQIDVTGDSKGHMAVICKATDNPAAGNKLNFRLKVDQTYLPAILRSLDEVTKVYPTIAQP